MKIQIVNEDGSSKKNPWPTIRNIALILFACALIFLILRKCGTEKNTHTDESKDVEAIRKRELIDNANKYQRLMDSMRLVNSSIVHENEKLQEENRRLRISAIVTENKVVQLIAKGRELRAANNIPELLKNCDSLETQAAVLVMKMDEQAYQHNLIVNGYEHQISINNEMLKQSDIRIMSLSNSLDTVSSKYGGLYTDYSKLIKRANEEQALNKGLAIAAAAEFIYIIVDVINSKR